MVFYNVNIVYIGVFMTCSTLTDPWNMCVCVCVCVHVHACVHIQMYLLYKNQPYTP